MEYTTTKRHKRQKVKTQGRATCKLLNTTRQGDAHGTITHTYTTSKKQERADGHTQRHEGTRTRGRGTKKRRLTRGSEEVFSSSPQQVEWTQCEAKWWLGGRGGGGGYWDSMFVLLEEDEDAEEKKK